MFLCPSDQMSSVKCNIKALGPRHIIFNYLHFEVHVFESVTKKRGEKRGKGEEKFIHYIIRLNY